MTNRPLNVVLPQLRAAGERDGAGSTDGELLTRFLSHRDVDALAALVERHAPMVWGVCRRVLSNPHDAEDAFQATFLVLVRKAASIMSREMVANWLYGVAHQTAVRLKATAAKRGVREMQLKDMPEPAAAEARVSDLLPLLDQELSRLPELHRVLIVLCDLEGKTRKEAARQLGCPEGTVASRLARARDMLAKRMGRHGLAVSGGSLAAAFSQSAASAGVPNSVVASTIHVATLLAANQAVGVISGSVAALTEGVLKTMLLKKIMTTTMVVLALSVAVITGGSLAIGQTGGTGKQADKPPIAAEKPIDKPPPTAVAAKDAVVNTPTILGKLQGEWELQPKAEGEYKQRLIFTASSSGNWQRSKETLPVSITYYVEGRELLIQFYHEPNGAFNYRLKQLRFEYELDKDILTLTAGEATQTWKRIPKASQNPAPAVRVKPADPPKAEAAPKDEYLIQGTWVVSELKQVGRVTTDEENKFYAAGGYKITFTADTMTHEIDKSSAKYRLDSDKDPKQFQLLDGDAVVALGIFELTGDDLKVCIGRKPEKGMSPVAPTGFDPATAPPGTFPTLFVMKRVKAEEAFTAWGKEVGGLQAGLGFKAGEKRIYTLGETVTLVARVRNVGKEAITFSRDHGIWMLRNPLAVTDSNGKAVYVGCYRPVGSMGLLQDKQKLLPGEEAEYDKIELQLRPTIEKRDQETGNTLFGTGKFQFEYSTDWHGTKERVRNTTGKLELEVKEAVGKLPPPKMPTEKPAMELPPGLPKLPAATDNAATAPAKPKPNYVKVVGQLLDDATGLPIEKAAWEFGMASLQKPSEIAWGHSWSTGGSHPSGKFEKAVHFTPDGRFDRLRVYAAGYETADVVLDLPNPRPLHVERTVRLKRGRTVTGVLRDYAGKPVANGWVFFIPKGHRPNIVEGVPGTDAHQLPKESRDAAVAEVRTNENGTFFLPATVGGTLAASTDLVDLWPFPLPDDGHADLKMPAPSYLVIDLTYWYLDERVNKGNRALSPSSEDPNQCWIQVDQSGSAEPLWKNVDYRRMMLVFAKDPRAKLSKGVIVGQVTEGEMDKAIPGVGHNKNLSTVIRVALPPGNFRVQRLRAGPFAPVAEQNVVLKAGEDTKVDWARGDGSSVRGKATWPANMMFVRQPGEAPRKLDWTVPNTASVRIAPINADGKEGQPIEAAKIQADDGFFVATNLDPGKYKASAQVYLPESDIRRITDGYRGPDCIYSQEFTVPDPARGPFGSPPVEVEIKMTVGADGVRFIAADPPAAPAKPVNKVEPPAEKEKEPFTAWGMEVGGLQAGLGFKAGEKRVYSHGETATLVVRVRNVVKNPLAASTLTNTDKYIPGFYFDWPPTVADGNGKAVALIRVASRGGDYNTKNLTVEFGNEVELAEVKLELKPESESGDRGSNVLYGTGKFQVHYERLMYGSGKWAISSILSNLATGKLELEVKDASEEKLKVLTPEEVIKIGGKKFNATKPAVEFKVEFVTKAIQIKASGEKDAAWVHGHSPNDVCLGTLVAADDPQRKTRFVAILTQKVIGQLNKAGIDDREKHFKGKTVRVTGPISMHANDGEGSIPEVEVVLDDMSRLEVVK